MIDIVQAEAQDLGRLRQGRKVGDGVEIHGVTMLERRMRLTWRFAPAGGEFGEGPRVQGFIGRRAKKGPTLVDGKAQHTVFFKR